MRRKPIVSSIHTNYYSSPDRCGEIEVKYLVKIKGIGEERLKNLEKVFR